jgi:hypothetical protein
VIALSDIVKVFGDESVTGLSTENIAKLENDVKLAAKQIETEYPLLHAHAIMGEWGALECFVEDLVDAWIRFKPEVLQAPIFAKVKIPFVDFMAMSEDERLAHLVSEVQRDLKLDLKSGATKFEKLLDVIGLDGAVDPRIRDALFEVQNVRNVWAHRSGFADGRLVKSCPNLGVTEGRRVNVTRSMYDRYHWAIALYVVTILNRCRVITGESPIEIDFPGFVGAVAFGNRVPEIDGNGNK